jgi:hypothetical protein
MALFSCGATTANHNRARHAVPQRRNQLRWRFEKSSEETNAASHTQKAREQQDGFVS